MYVKDIMSTPVVFTQNQVKVGHLKDQFNRKSINAIPVMEENGDISGIVSASDLVAIHDDNLTAKDIKTDKVHIAIPEHRVKDAAKMMVKNNCHHLVVMEEGKVVGMISSMDMVKVLADQ